jgi:hypothetical protein
LAIDKVLIRAHGGTWEADAGTVTLPSGQTWNVEAWATKRLHFGIQDSLVAKARVAGQLASPAPEPDWDPRWPEDHALARQLADDLGLGSPDRDQIDELITEWLRLRKSCYLERPNPNLGRRPVDDSLEETRSLLSDGSGRSSEMQAYALARRHKAHAWVQHWRFGNSLSGPSGFLVVGQDKDAVALQPGEFRSLVAYLATSPQYRDHAVLDVIWRSEKLSKFRVRAESPVRLAVSLDLLVMVSDTHPWTAAPHIKRLLELADLTDEGFLDAFRRIESEHWRSFWQIVRSIVDCAGVADDLRFGAKVFEWLDTSRGREPSALWLGRFNELAESDRGALLRLTSWLEAEGETLRRFKDTGEVIEPVSRWVKGACWARQREELATTRR